MATWPAKTNYATGDVLTAAQMQDIGNALNSVQSAQYAAGKNKIINGDFAINQRSFSSTTTNATYCFDRWFLGANDGTVTATAQTFTPGAAPVAGYESSNFFRIQSTGQTLTSAISYVSQRIEDVRTLANQTVTVSFWAKANSGTPKVGVLLSQNFGSGGSAAVDTPLGAITISTSWTRYSATVAVPSISGKTIGTASQLRLLLWTSAGTDYNTAASSIGIQSNTIDFWGVQVEAGNTATAFQTATGTLAGELAACQRYYYRFVPNGVNTSWIGSGFAYGTGTFLCSVRLPVTMRVNPTSIETSGTASHYRMLVGSTVATASGVPTLDTSNWDNTVLAVSTSGLTVGQGGILGFNSTASGYIGFVAEL